MLKDGAQYLMYGLFGMARGERLSDDAEFFVYDTIKIFLLLSVMIFAASVIRSFFSPEKTKRILSHERECIGNILAALLGIVTPFCSCSAVPLSIGFVEAGVPLGVTVSFLLSSPMVNEVAVVLLWGLFGWKVAAIYLSAGLSVAIIAGFIIGKLKLEAWVEEYVCRIRSMAAAVNGIKRTFSDRFLYARDTTRGGLQKVRPDIIVAVGIGGFIHGYVPQDFLVRYAGSWNPFGVPVAVAPGGPLCSNAAGGIPGVFALGEKGMSRVTALSLPEMIILRKVLKVRILAVLVGIMTVTVIGIGYRFNAIFAGDLSDENASQSMAAAA